MKNRFKLLLFLVLIFPFVVNASGFNYDDSVHYANNYIQRFAKYNNYLYFDNNLSYVYENGNFVNNNIFVTGGLLSKSEYEISNGKNNTYLSNGLEYWTLTKSSALKHFVINYTLMEKNDSSETGVRITEYVKNNVGVSGTGSFSNPWSFNELLNIHMTSTNKLRGLVSSGTCDKSDLKREDLSISFTSGNSANVYLCPNNGFRVYTNSCSSYMTNEGNNLFTIEGVNKDNLICNVGFTYITNEVNLSCTGCVSNGSPNKVYASTATHDLWFSDSDGVNQITKITTKPSKKGYTYAGYKLDNKLIIDSSGKFVDGATAYVSDKSSLDATFSPNTYVVSFNTGHVTSNDHTTTTNVVYDSSLADIKIPSRIYTINYNGNGGTASKDSDQVSYTFDGYLHNDVKYYNSNGKGVRNWDIDSNTTLVASWTGGEITFASATREGHVFEGWTLNSDGSGTVFKDKYDVFSLMDGNKSSATLYAKWTKCSAGTYLINNTCAMCPAGQYSNGGTNNCTLCAAGTYSSKGASKCTLCALNKYSSEGAGKCTDCDPGTYTTEKGSATCEKCPAGSSCAGGATPQACPNGTYSTMGSSSCSDCGAGTYNTGTGNTGCEPCPAGYRCTGGPNIEMCPAGYYSKEGSVSCSRCPAGTYSAAGSSSCTNCLAGTYSKAGASKCTDCVAGTYSKEKASNCTNCAAGTYSGKKASKCTACPAGSYCPGASDKIPCSAGTYSAAGSTSCTDCLAGTYSKAGASKCTDCAAGTYSGAKASKCTNCAAGKYSGAKASSCTDCAANTYSAAGAATCTACASCYSSGTGASSCSLIKYTIKYSLDGGSGTFGDQTKNCGSDLTLHSATPTKSGFTFNGWKASNGTSYAAGAKYTANSGTTLTAQWKAAYEDKWVKGKTGITEFERTKHNTWASGGNLRLVWEEYYNAAQNKSYIKFTAFQATSNSAIGIAYVGGANNESRGILILDSSGNKELVQKFDYTMGYTVFSFGNADKGKWIDVRDATTSQSVHTTPPYESKKYDHNSDGTLSLTLRVDLIVGSIYESNREFKNSATWKNVDKTITLTDLRE